MIVTVALSLVLAACAAGGIDEGAPTVPESEEEPMSTTGVHAAAIEYAMGQGQAVVGDLAYVAGPLPETWDRWCGFESDQVPCLALQAMTIDLAAPFDEAARAEIEGALAPMMAEFIEDPESVIEPMEQSMMVAPIKNDAALLVFGRPIWADDKVYLPLDGHGKGWLLEATPTDDGWEISPLALWIA